MPGKKWCEFCRINLPYSKKDIEAHEATRTHLQNKQKAIKFERIKIRKERSQIKQTQHQVMLGTANIPKAKRGSQLQQQVRAYQDSVIDEGKRAIHRMIAERTQGMFGAPIQYPEKEDLVLAENYQDDDQSSDQEGSEKEQNFEMWKIDICEKTGDACFLNRITKLVLYEPPKGYVLSEEQKQEWEYLKQICKDKVQINPEATVNITEWEEVPDEENYFEVNKAVDSEEQVSEQLQQDKTSTVDHKKYITKKEEEEIKHQEAKPKTWKDELQEKLINNEISTSEVFEKFIENEMKNSKTIKEKNENLKKLIESGIEVRSRPTDELLYPEQSQIKLEDKPKVGFKPRKKVQVSTGVKLTEENDIF